MAEEKIYTVSEAESGLRLDKFLSRKPELSVSRSYLSKLIQEGEILLRGERAKASCKLKAGEEIRLRLPEAKAPEIPAESIPLDILYEDEDILLINKGKNMVVHPAPGHGSGTLVNALLYHCGDSLSGINGVSRPGIVHRIDKDTTGVLLVCKSDFAHRALAEELKLHHMERQYLALVYGKVKEEEGTVDAPLARHRTERRKQAVDFERGREAVTHYRVLERFTKYTLLRCQLETGRTHQIRVHMQYIGHPVLGDPLYGPKKCEFRLEGQCLHAETLVLRHPRSGELMRFRAPCPVYFEKLLRLLRNRYGSGTNGYDA